MNATSNYFKTSKGHIFFFVDTVLESIESAFETASLVDAELSVYRAVGIQGPWDTAKIIGHRRRAPPRPGGRQNLRRAGLAARCGGRRDRPAWRP